MQQYFAKEKVNNRFVLSDQDYFHIEKVMRMILKNGLVGL